MRVVLWALCAVVACGLSAGCAYQGPPVTFGGSYTTREGAVFGGSVRLDPTFARQKK